MPAKYRVIANELREQIAGGTLQPGDRLPTEAEIQDRYEVSRNTARLAHGVLVNEGLVESVPGRSGGMVVRERVTLTFHASRAELGKPTSETDAWHSEVRAQGHTPSQSFELHVVALSAELAERLHVEADSAAAVRRCVRYVNGQPSSVQDTYYPRDLCDQVPELMQPHDIPIGTTALLAERGWEQTAMVDEIAAAMPTPDQAQLLGLRPGTPVLVYIRTGYAADRPVRTSVTLFAGDRNRLSYVLGDAALVDQLREADQ